MFKTRSGRIFSPYEPWDSPSSFPPLAPPSKRDTGPDDALALNLSALDIQVPFTSAFDAEIAHAISGVDDCDGLELSPPPSAFAGSPQLLPPLPPLPLLDSIPLPPPRLDPHARLNSIPCAEVTRDVPPTRQQRGKAARQRRNRQEKRFRDGAFDTKIRSPASIKWSKPHRLVSDHTVATALKISTTGYLGASTPKGRDRAWALVELVEEGFQVIKWDGITPTAILDSKGRIIAMLTGRPSDTGWEDVIKKAIEALEAAGRGVRWTWEDVNHRRGFFAALTTGVSYGGGQTIPANLRNSKSRQKIIDGLLQHPSFHRIAGWGSSQFAFWFPKVYRHYVSRLQPLFNRYTHLRHNFNNSVFPACTFNATPNTVALDHADKGNWAGGPCQITSGGTFDHAKGGHIILFDLKRVIQFPSGSTILIPSASIRHGNTPIQPGETRYSFTQYCAGGLLRWVDCGFRSLQDCAEKVPSIYEDIVSNSQRRCQAALDMLSFVDSVHNDRMEVLNA